MMLVLVVAVEIKQPKKRMNPCFVSRVKYQGPISVEDSADRAGSGGHKTKGTHNTYTAHQSPLTDPRMLVTRHADACERSTGGAQTLLTGNYGSPVTRNEIPAGSRAPPRL
ncbi:hypothetical protein ACJJTC_001125 [Scirpophaga incertulas]